MIINCKKISKFTATIALCTALAGMTAFAANRIEMNLTYDGQVHKYNAEEIFIHVNGSPVTNLIMPPVSINDRTLVPAREVFEKLGAAVSWNNITREVTVTRGTDKVVLQINNAAGTKNGSTFSMEVSPKIINEKTMIPVRYAAEALDCLVDWDETTRTVKIDDKQQAQPINIIKAEAVSDNTIVIEASGPIEQYKKVYVDSTRAVLDIYNAKVAVDETVPLTDHTFVSAIRSGQYEAAISRTVLDLKTDAKYTVAQSADKTMLTVTFDPATITQTTAKFQNFSYDKLTQVLTIEKQQALDSNAIVHTDDYLHGQYSLTLPGDYSSVFGSDTFAINDSYLGSIAVKNNQNGDTVFTLNEKKILACSISETESSVQIKLLLPKEKYDKIVVLDAGHGGKDPGAAGNGLIEKEVNLAIMTKVSSLLDADGIKVYATRVGDTYPSLLDRANMANQVGDLFVSIHQNSSTSTAPSGTEVLYTPHSNETADKLTSKQAAQVMQQKLIAALGSINRGIQNHPTLAVLNKTKVPAILIEVGFLSNAAEAGKLRTEEYQNIAADAIYNGITELLTQNKIR